MKKFRVIHNTNYFKLFAYICQYKRFGIWWDFDSFDNVEDAMEACRRRANPVVWFLDQP